MSNMYGKFRVAFVFTLLTFGHNVAVDATPIVVDLASRDIVYSPLDDTIYASVPNSSAKYPNTLVPIHPSTGAIGTPIAIGFDPSDVVISSDGTKIFTVFGGNRGVQPYDVPSQSLGTPFFITGGPVVKGTQIHPIPGRPDAVLIATKRPGISPPAGGTRVWENGVQLPKTIGAGSGGPDVVAVDISDGTRAYGYENSVSNYTNWSLTIDANGVATDGGPTLQGVLRGFNVGRIDLLGNTLFTERGEVFSISPAFQRGVFQGGGNYVIDPDNDGLISVTSSGSDQTIHDYSINPFQLVGEETISGIPGTIGSLTRLGTDGLAFRTSNDQIVMVRDLDLLGPAPNGLVRLDSFGQTYTQSFDAALGSSGLTVGLRLPPGWSTDNAGTTATTITKRFPTSGGVPVGTYNAGEGSDRALATGNVNRDAGNTIQLWGRLEGTADVAAVVLEVRVEAWLGDASQADNPGEAAFIASLEFDETGTGTYSTAHTFNGGAPVTTTLSLLPGLLDGNDAAGLSFSSELVELPTPIPAGSDIRLTFDAQGVGQTQGYIFGVDDVLFRIVPPGDTDGNGELDDLDVAAIVDANKFNNPAFGPATWAEGDFNGDDLVNSTDIFLALASGKYKQGPFTRTTPRSDLATVPEPSTFVLAAIGLVGLLVFARRRQGNATKTT